MIGDEPDLRDASGGACFPAGRSESLQGDLSRGRPADGVPRHHEDQAGHAENQEQRPQVCRGRDRDPEAGADGQIGRDTERTLRQERQDRGRHNVASDIEAPARQ